MQTRTRLLIALMFACLATTAEAQINSPPPALMGEPSYHIYSVPITTTGGGIRPFFLCTNTTDVAIRVGVEGFSGNGGPPVNDASATSLSVPASGTRLFGEAAVGLSPSVNPGLGPGTKSARILATESRGIICTAFLADIVSDPPTSMVQLTIVKKTKQKGD